MLVDTQASRDDANISKMKRRQQCCFELRMIWRGRKQILQSSIIWCVNNKHHEFTVTVVVRMVHDIVPGPASSCFRFLLGESRQPRQLPVVITSHGVSSQVTGTQPRKIHTGWKWQTLCVSNILTYNNYHSVW